MHFFSRAFFASLARQKETSVEALGTILGWEMPPADPGQLAARWVAELDRHGVERAALMASVPGDENSVATAIARFPDKFFGCFMFDPLAPALFDARRSHPASL